MTIRPTRMKSVGTLLAVFALTAIAAGQLRGSAAVGQERLVGQTDLDRYVNQADSSFRWEIVTQNEEAGLKTYVIDMVSQRWRTEKDVDRTEWRHWVTVARPEKTRSNIGFLWIGGGRNGGDPPDGPSDRVKRIAQATGTVVAELYMVPNQPLIFHQDGQPRTEDDLIGYTWDQFLETGDTSWPARNPMVKSAVRAMDAVSQLTTTPSDGGQPVEKFVVAGGSKRGWTTWLTGAVDKRVVAIVPIVIDVVNVRPSMLHHFAAYGFWAPAVGDYVAHRIMERMDHPRMEALYQLVDPHYYRHRLTMPKFIVNASGDQFFLPDSSQFYFDELEGENYLRYVPNADHSLKNTDALESIVAFYDTVVSGRKRPQFTWEMLEDGIRVTTQDQPRKVTLWQATNPEARDFRMEELGPAYEATLLQPSGGGVYETRVPAPQQGWTAFFIELVYDVGAPVPATFTTAVKILPDVLPHADKDPMRPARLLIKCLAPDQRVAASIETEASNYFAADDRQSRDAPWSEAARQGNGSLAKRFSVTWGEVQRSGRMLTLRWKADGQLRASAKVIAAWLQAQGCSDLAFRLESAAQ